MAGNDLSFEPGSVIAIFVVGGFVFMAEAQTTTVRQKMKFETRTGPAIASASKNCRCSLCRGFSDERQDIQNALPDFRFLRPPLFTIAGRWRGRAVTASPTQPR
jgi:hypothetical protein